MHARLDCDDCRVSSTFTYLGSPFLSLHLVDVHHHLNCLIHLLVAAHLFVLRATCWRGISHEQHWTSLVHAQTSSIDIVNE